MPDFLHALFGARLVGNKRQSFFVIRKRYSKFLFFVCFICFCNKLIKGHLIENALHNLLSFGDPFGSCRIAGFERKCIFELCKRTIVELFRELPVTFFHGFFVVLLFFRLFLLICQQSVYFIDLILGISFVWFYFQRLLELSKRFIIQKLFQGFITTGDQVIVFLFLMQKFLYLCNLIQLSDYIFVGRFYRKRPVVVPFGPGIILLVKKQVSVFHEFIKTFEHGFVKLSGHHDQPQQIIDFCDTIFRELFIRENFCGGFVAIECVHKLFVGIFFTGLLKQFVVFFSEFG